MRDIITKNNAMIKLLQMAENVAPTKASILILGESGTGKEMFAQLIHNSSYRKDKKMVAINCAALPETLLEAELFGFERGAFTGSIATKIGKFEKASQSTILLDEISEMTPHMQAKLLRVLQESEIDRIGALDPISLDLRVIATSNRDLSAEVKEGKFRQDLYYRLNVVSINLPPLRERMDDIPLLASHFVAEFNNLYNKDIQIIPNTIINRLQSYSYPGNVRELRNIIEKAVIFSQGSLLNEEYIDNLKTDNFSKNSLLENSEKIAILKVLAEENGNKTHTADKLGISIRTLRNKLNLYKGETSVA